jgi:hypothetical protein
MMSGAGAVVIGAHLFCQIFYSLAMWGQTESARMRVLWLLVIWALPVIGIGLAGARFSRATTGKVR